MGRALEPHCSRAGHCRACACGVTRAGSNVGTSGPSVSQLQPSESGFPDELRSVKGACEVGGCPTNPPKPLLTLTRSNVPFLAPPQPPTATTYSCAFHGLLSRLGRLRMPEGLSRPLARASRASPAQPVEGAACAAPAHWRLKRVGACCKGFCACA